MLGSCLAVEESQAATLQPGPCSMSLTAAEGEEVWRELRSRCIFFLDYMDIIRDPRPLKQQQVNDST